MNSQVSEWLTIFDSGEERLICTHFFFQQALMLKKKTQLSYLVSGLINQEA